MRRVSAGRLARLVVLLTGLAMSVSAQDRGGYAELLEVFGEFRAFSQAGYDGDIADYPTAMEQKAGQLKEFQQRLAAIDVSSWPISDALDFIDRFIRDQDIYTVPDYLVDDAYRQRRIAATSEPWPETHDYFYVFSHRETLMEETHEMVGHYYDLLRQQNGSHPIRNAREHEGPYNMSVARWEGLAFAYEELLMHAGYLDERSPHAREIVYAQAAFRTVRALSDLYMHAGEWDIEEAIEYSIEHAPYGERLRGTNHLWAEVAETNLRLVGWHTQMVVGADPGRPAAASPGLIQGGIVTLTRTSCANTGLPRRKRSHRALQAVGRWGAGHQAKQQHTQAVDVGAHGGNAAAQHLGCHVERRADRCRTTQRHLAGEIAAGPEVHQDNAAALLTNHVLRLDVAVHHALTVHRGQRRAQVDTDQAGLARPEPPLHLQQVLEVPAVDVFHPETDGIVVHADAVHLEHVGVAYPRQHPPLAQNATRNLRRNVGAAVAARAEQLQRHRRVE